MAALAAERNTPQKADVSRSPLSWPQGVNTIWKGSLVVLNAAGFAEPGTTATAKVAIGRAKKTVVNAGSAGDTNVEIEEGIFKWGNSGGDLVVAADRGLSVYITDDQTVNHTATGKSVAGKCVQIDSDGVWVKTSL
jgi:hypothetical protein